MPDPRLARRLGDQTGKHEGGSSKVFLLVAGRPRADRWAGAPLQPGGSFQQRYLERGRVSLDRRCIADMPENN